MNSLNRMKLCHENLPQASDVFSGLHPLSPGQLHSPKRLACVVATRIGIYTNDNGKGSKYLPLSQRDASIALSAHVQPRCQVYTLPQVSTKDILALGM